jgi:ribonuclease D
MDVPVLRGWRKKLFGDAALALKRGELALAIKDGEVTVIGPEPLVATNAAEQPKSKA